MDLLGGYGSSDDDDDDSSKKMAEAPPPTNKAARVPLPSAADMFATVGAGQGTSVEAKRRAGEASGAAPQPKRHQTTAAAAPATGAGAAVKPKPAATAAKGGVAGGAFMPRQVAKPGAANAVTEDIGSWTSDANRSRRKSKGGTPADASSTS